MKSRLCFKLVQNSTKIPPLQKFRVRITQYLVTFLRFSNVLKKNMLHWWQMHLGCQLLQVLGGRIGGSRLLVSEKRKRNKASRSQSQALHINTRSNRISIFCTRNQTHCLKRRLFRGNIWEWTLWTSSDAVAPAQEIALIALEPVDRRKFSERSWDPSQNI